MPSTIKSLTDPKGDLTIFCKEVVQSEAQLIPGEVLVSPTVQFLGSKITTVSNAHAIVSYTRLNNDAKEIIRKITLSFDADIVSIASGEVMTLLGITDVMTPLGYVANTSFYGLRSLSSNPNIENVKVSLSEGTFNNTLLDTTGTDTGVHFSFILEDLFVPAP